MGGDNQNKRLVRDIYHPERYYLDYDVGTQKFAKKPIPVSFFHRGFVYAFLCALVLVVGFYSFRLFILKDLLDSSTEEIYVQLVRAKTALASLDPELAKESFMAVEDELESILTNSKKYGVLALSSVGGRFFSQIQDLPDVFKELIGVSQTAVDISEDVTFLKNEALSLVLEQRGEELISRLRGFEEKIETLEAYAHILEGRNAQLGNLTEQLPELISQLRELGGVNRAIISFLDSKNDRDVLVLLQNSSEMRPGGGFIGSYAHVLLDHGSLKDIDVVDIYDPDGQLDLKIIPPPPLQLITKNWGARDSNWFFDFPTSANQVMDLLNSSKIYQERGVVFDSVIALNDKVLGDVIRLIEPIDLPEYALSLDSENFLAEIQREVEAGKDKARGEPKKILKVLTPMIIDRLANLNDSDQLVLKDLVGYHIQTRNIMAYVNNAVLEDYIQKAGLGGEVAQFSDEVFADYLAIVNANIAGQKTDIFMDQSIDLVSTVSADGGVENVVSVTRTHNGVGQKEWWYNATNKDYMQIFTPIDSRATLAAGQDKWPADPKYNYAGYETDGDLAQILSNLTFLADLEIEEFISDDKQVFAGWLNTGVGKTKTFELTYKLNQRIDLSRSHVPLRAVFERQSGVATSFNYLIKAPAGFYWQESGANIFEYRDLDPAGRVIIELTLVRANSQG